MKRGVLLLAVAAALSCSEGFCAPYPKREAPSGGPGNPSAEGLPPVPELAVIRTARSPIIDGDLGDEVWRYTGKTAAFVDTRTGARAAFFAQARALWDDENLYVAIDVRDRLLRGTHVEHDDKLWEQDCVEMFIDPDGDGNHYFEIQVSPAGVTFDTHYASRRKPEPFGTVEWESGMTFAVKVRGTLNDDKRDHGYSVEMAIPWASFTTKAVHTPIPDKGDHWRANFYVMDLQQNRQLAGGWSAPMVGDFHVPARFGVLRFEDPQVGFSGPARLSPERAEQMKGRFPGRADALKKKIVHEKLIDRRHPGEPAPLGVPGGESATE